MLPRYKYKTLIQMWELLICPICKDLFENPKILPCVHSFCKSCLDELTRVNQDEFHCPVCRAPITLPPGGVANIPSNFFLNSILDIMKRQRKSCGEEIVCGACSVNVLSTLRCTDCDVLLCAKCLHVHENQNLHSKAVQGCQPKTTSTGNEVVQPSRQHDLHMPLKCEDHPKKDLKFFCSSCAQLACEDCVIAKHITHIFVSAADAVPSCKAKLNTLLNQIIGKILFLSDALKDTKDTEEHLRSCVTNIRNRICTAKTKLLKQNQEITQQLDEDERRLMSRLDRVSGMKFEVLGQHRRKLETRLGLIENCRKFTSHLMLNGSDEEILTMENCIMESLGNLCQHTPEIPIECPEDSFIGFKVELDRSEETVGASDAVCNTYIDGENVLGNIEPGEGCAGCCFATGEGLTCSVVGQDTTFTVTVKNKHNKASLEGRDTIVARVKCPRGGYLRAELMEHKLGKHKFRYRTYIAGPHLLRITLKGEEILGSPFEPLSNGSTDYSRRGRLVTKFGRSGSGNGELSRPQGLAVDRLSRIYVADTGNHRIQVFSETGRLLFAFGTMGLEVGQFNEPCDLTIARTGQVVVADKLNNRIQLFTSDGNFVNQLNSGIVRPTAVTMDTYNNIILVDNDHSRVSVLTMAGERLRSIGQGLAKGQELENVHDVTCSQNGELLLISRIANKKDRVALTTKQSYTTLIQVFNNNGRYTREFIVPSNVCSPSNRCRLVTDNDDRVVTTGAGNKVQVFTRVGGHLTNITFTEKDYKQIEIGAIALSPNESVVVADSINERILVF